MTSPSPGPPVPRWPATRFSSCQENGLLGGALLPGPGAPHPDARTQERESIGGAQVGRVRMTPPRPCPSAAGTVSRSSRGAPNLRERIEVRTAAASRPRPTAGNNRLSHAPVLPLAIASRIPKKAAGSAMRFHSTAKAHRPAAGAPAGIAHVPCRPVNSPTPGLVGMLLPGLFTPSTLASPRGHGCESTQPADAEREPECGQRGRPGPITGDQLGDRERDRSDAPAKNGSTNNAAHANPSIGLAVTAALPSRSACPGDHPIRSSCHRTRRPGRGRAGGARTRGCRPSCRTRRW